MFKFIIASLIVISSPSSSASLIDLGDGLIFDSDLEITWLQDASYAKTSGYDADGLMSWNEAVIWADTLVYGGYDDWRLPAIFPLSGMSYNASGSFDGSTDHSYNIGLDATLYSGSTASELAHLYFQSLGNVSALNIDGSNNLSAPLHTGLANIGPFTNVVLNSYWSGNEFEGGGQQVAWQFQFSVGQQGSGSSYHEFSSWAVRGALSGGNEVPEPNTLVIFMIGLLAMFRYLKLNPGR